ncbi:MAG: transcriptional regulator FtrA [Rhodobacteraceae bacterium]|nr:transcriptional regulator FtrA [Paracoccaceae bacterium]
MHRVKTLAYNGLCTFEFGIATELFALPRPEFPSWYTFQTVALEPEIWATGGVRIRVDGTLEGLKNADTIILPGWRDPAERPPEPLLHALRAAHENGTRLFSICSGVFILAAAGLLDGKRATTHWRYTEALQSRFPKIKVQSDVLYIEDSNILTSAGSAAGIDAGLHLIRQDFGSAIANTVARRLVLPPHRDGGQAQFIPPSQPRGGQTMAALMEWARQNLAQPLRLRALAAQAGMTERTFQRRFRAETGMAPMAWLRRERLFHAQALLETTLAPLAEIAHISGYESLNTFRIAFKRALNTSPAAYRAHFGAKKHPS